VFLRHALHLLSQAYLAAEYMVRAGVRFGPHHEETLQVWKEPFATVFRARSVCMSGWNLLWTSPQMSLLAAVVAFATLPCPKAHRVYILTDPFLRKELLEYGAATFPCSSWWCLWKIQTWVYADQNQRTISRLGFTLYTHTYVQTCVSMMHDVRRSLC
jgi:hypothetical protein